MLETTPKSRRKIESQALMLVGLAWAILQPGQAVAEIFPPGPAEQNAVLLQALTGDNPLTTLEYFEGKVDVVVNVVAGNSRMNPSGVFSIWNRSKTIPFRSMASHVSRFPSMTTLQ